MKQSYFLAQFAALRRFFAFFGKDSFYFRGMGDRPGRASLLDVAKGSTSDGRAAASGPRLENLLLVVAGR